MLESLISDVRYALRGLRRAPLFSASVAGTIGLGLGILCSGFTILNAYVFRPVDLPNPHQLYSLTWDTEGTKARPFSLADFDAMRSSSPHFSKLAAAETAVVMHDGTALTALLVTGDYFQLLGANAAIGRTLAPADAAVVGAEAVVVLSNGTWKSRFGGDPAIVGKHVQFGGQRLEVVGVMPSGFGLGNDALLAFWAPLTMARALKATDPWGDVTLPALTVMGRAKEGTTEPQIRAWFDVWLRQRFPAGSEAAPVAVRVESRETRIQMNAAMTGLVALIVSACGLVLLVACANVTNLMLARAVARQREMAVRLSLGASRWRVARQLIVESLLLAVPAAAVGLALTFVTARAFPALVLATFPKGVFSSLEAILAPMDPDVRVISLLALAAVAAAVMVSMAPTLRVTRANLARASKGESAVDERRSRLRSALVAMQVGACVLFLVCATGLVNESQRVASPDTRLEYQRVADVRMAPHLRVDVATRLRSDPSVEHVAAAWDPPLWGSFPSIGVVASGTRIELAANFMGVSPEYFPMLGISVVRGRAFTPLEADESAAVVLVSEATARALWPGLDPIGQTLDLLPAHAAGSERRPEYTQVRVIGVTEDVGNGSIIEGIDATCVYFSTSLRAPGEMSMLVRSRGNPASVRAVVTAALDAIEPDAPFRFFVLGELVGGAAWIFWALSAVAAFLGVIGLVLAFSGTYAVLAFIVTQRTRELGVRMALGATVRQVVTGLMSEMMRTALIGIGAGLALALAVSRLAGGTVPIFPRLDLQPYVVGTAIVLTATFVAALLPSLRTSRIDPAKALRVE